MIRNSLIILALLALMASLPAEAGPPVEVRHLSVPAKGQSTLYIPVGMQVCFTAIGRWNPAMEGSAGILVSSFSGRGAPVVTMYGKRSKVGESLTDKRMTAPSLPFFGLVWRETGSEEYRSFSSSGWSYANSKAGGRTLEFRMNDEVDAYHNNTGALTLLYFFQEGYAMPWGVSMDSFRIGENLRYSSSSMVVDYSPHLRLDWWISHYNEASTPGKYEYSFWIANEGDAPISGWLKARDNLENIRWLWFAVEGASSQRLWTLLEGMSVVEVEISSKKQ